MERFNAPEPLARTRPREPSPRTPHDNRSREANARAHSEDPLRGPMMNVHDDDFAGHALHRRAVRAEHEDSSRGAISSSVGALREPMKRGPLRRCRTRTHYKDSLRNFNNSELPLVSNLKLKYLQVPITSKFKLQ